MKLSQTFVEEHHIILYIYICKHIRVRANFFLLRTVKLRNSVDIEMARDERNDSFAIEKVRDEKKIFCET